MRHRYSVWALWAVSLAAPLGLARRADADWPTWRGDVRRGAATDQPLPAALSLQWRLQLPPPRPAWPVEQGKLRFDTSYEPVAARGLLYVPSMVDDSLAAYRLTDGGLQWRFFADGPVRFAPALHGERVLFVSDDGHLYCLQADSGTLLWKLRGGPDGRRVLGNDRLVSMWPARGAPVVYGDTIYFAAGLWPFMGVFVHAVDSESGQVLWTNSGTGAEYTVQQHNSPAFAGVAPQGYMSANASSLLVSGGRTVPAVLDRGTGQLQYYRPSDRQLGKDQGGYAVILGSDWFAIRGGLYRLSDGAPLASTAVDVIAAEGAYGIESDQLVAYEDRLARTVHTSVDKRGQEQQTVKEDLPVRWRRSLPAGITNLHAKVSDRFVVSDGDVRLLLISAPETDGAACQVEWGTTLNAAVWQVLVADQRLIVVDQAGAIYCFGASAEGRDAAPVEQLADAPKPAAVAAPGLADAASATVAAWLAHTPARAGYAVLDQPHDVEAVAALAAATDFHILVVQEDGRRVDRWRSDLRSRGWLAARVAVVHGNLITAQLPPYVASLVIAPGLFASAAVDAGVKALEVLRPYGGVAVVGPHAQAEPWQKALAGARQAEYRLESHDAQVTVERFGPLPGAGSWTSQTGNAGNTLVSTESRVGIPLGLLWFGGPSHEGVLPRHGHGPMPQVLGGRLFIQGRDMLRAVDVYTGRLLWQQAFPDVGIFYDNVAHHPGAAAIGGNYVTTADSIYLAWGRRCLRLDPASGATLAEFVLPADESGAQPFWSYLGVEGDSLVAGSSPMLLLAAAPGEKIDTDDKEQLQRNVPLFGEFGEGSRRLVGLNRFTGEVRWMRDARFNFRHNAIALGDGKVFCIDRMTTQRLGFYRRRGEVPTTDFALLALDLETGSVVWEDTEHAFGTWLACSQPTGLLLQAGAKNRDRAADEVGKGLAVFDGETGQLRWRVDDDYYGPPLVYPDVIVTQGTAYDLLTGQRKMRTHPLTGESIPWTFTRNHGCDTAIGCMNLITFRSAAAGYYDLARDGGTGNLGGFRSSCTANLIAADGVLNAPDYTRTCTCSYQNQCSLALVSMPDVETWTFNAVPASNERVTRLGVNFGAPGDRRDEDGTLWLEFPSVGGSSPDVPLTIVGAPLEYVRQHASSVPGDYRPWVFASGVRGARRLRVRLAGGPAATTAPGSYTVRLYWRDQPTDLPPREVRLQGTPTDGAPFVTASGLVQEYRRVPVDEFLEIDLDTDLAADAVAEATLPPDAPPSPLLCGVEIVLEQR